MCVLLQKSNHADDHHHRHLQQQQKQRQPTTMTTTTPMNMNMNMMVINKCKATRRFNVLASEDTHNDYFRRSLAVTATTQRRVRFSNTIKVGFVVVSSTAAPLQEDDVGDDHHQGDDGQDENGSNDRSASSCLSSVPSTSPACSFSSSWYTSTDLARFKADAAEAVLRYRKGDRSEDMHGLEKHIVAPAAGAAATIRAATTATTTADAVSALPPPPPLPPALASAVASGHDNDVGTHERLYYQHHPSSPPPGAQKRVASLSPNHHPSARAA